MTIKELIVALLEFPSDHKVVVADVGGTRRHALLTGFKSALIDCSEKVWDFDMTDEEDWARTFLENGLDAPDYPGDDCVILYPHMKVK